MTTRTDKQTSAGKQAAVVLGRSPATGRFVLRPASKGGSISIKAAETAASKLRNGHKK